MGRRAPVVPKLRRGSGCPRAGVFEGVATPSNGSMEGRAQEGWGGGPLSRLGRTAPILPIFND